MSDFSRRSFLVGCSSAIAAMAGSRITYAALGPEIGSNDEVLIMIFLRGGMDGINFVLPIAGADRGHYETARPQIMVPVTGPDAALPLNAQFGLHPGAAALLPLYQAGKLAIVHAAGMNIASRSHFDAMEFLELGTPGVKTTTTGWLARHLATAANLPPDILIPSLAIGSNQPTSLLGDPDTVAMTRPDQFNLNTGPSSWRTLQRVAMRRMYETQATHLHDAGIQALNASDLVQAYVGSGYVPSNGAVYPSGSFGDQMKVMAQMIKLEVGLRVATIDLGGWDTHNSQGGATGTYANVLNTLSEGLAALYTDLDGSGANNHTQRLTMVVQSEFGRRFRENADRGTDHGHANRMMILGGNVNGGLFGPWPGLGPGQLFDNNDLAVTTDFRQVLSEIIIRRLANPNLGAIFPGYDQYDPLGVVSGPDLTPNFGNEIFRDGFDNGDFSGWSGVVGV